MHGLEAKHETYFALLFTLRTPNPLYHIPLSLIFRGCSLPWYRNEALRVNKEDSIPRFQMGVSIRGPRSRPPIGITTSFSL